MLFRSIAMLAAAGALTTAALAEQHENADPNVAARQAHMQLYGYNLGVLGGMAKGEIEYDAEVATGAAENLAAMSSLFMSRYWASGTDNFEMEGKTRALPDIWENMADFHSKEEALNTAAMKLAAVAGDGQAALGPALGEVGQACGACHKQYRQSNN